MSIKAIAAAAALAVLSAGSASAQGGGEARLFDRGHQKGRVSTFSGPQQDIGPLTVKSIEIPAGSAWELCTGKTFTGCKRFDQSKAAMVMKVRSVRPVAPPLAESASAASGVGIRGSGTSLRGLDAEFFVMPDQQGVRVEVTGGAGQASRVAIEFCRAKGWRTSTHERVQTVSGRVLLADVLCTNG
jgi:hypothetical protein